MGGRAMLIVYGYRSLLRLVPALKVATAERPKIERSSRAESHLFLISLLVWFSCWFSAFCSVLVMCPPF